MGICKICSQSGLAVGCTCNRVLIS